MRGKHCAFVALLPKRGLLTSSSDNVAHYVLEFGSPASLESAARHIKCPIHTRDARFQTAKSPCNSLLSDLCSAACCAVEDSDPCFRDCNLCTSGVSPIAGSNCL